MNKADYPTPSPKGKKLNSPAQTPLVNTNGANPSANLSNTSSNETTSKIGSKESDLFVLAQKLRQRNRTLQDQVVQLQESLRAAEEKLYSQSQQFSEQESIRSQEVGTIISQQSAETSYANEHAGRLLQELEGTHQLAQRQQILIETLSSELQTSQERIAQLERECALTQQQYNEQCHELLQSESRSQELNTRLLRQQRQALQFKVALEKSLEVPTANQTTSPILELPWQEEVEPETPYKVNPAALVSRINTQPIQPWSNLEEAESSPAIEEKQLTAATMPQISPIVEEQPQFPKPEKLRLNPTEEMMQPLILSLNPATPRLEPAPEPLFDVTEVNAYSDRFSAGSQNSFTLSPYTPAPVETRSQSPDLAQYLMSLQPEPEMMDISTNDQKLQQLLAVVKRSPYIPPESDEPAPIIYPERPPKKIPSLSAINLPNFPRHRPPEN